MSRYLAELPGRLGYLALMAALLLSQHFLAWEFAVPVHPEFIEHPAQFWLTPLRAALEWGDLSHGQAMLAIGYSLAVAWAVAGFSFWRARDSSLGVTPAVLSVIPIVQLLAIPALAFAPSRTPRADPAEADGHEPSSADAKRVVFGLIAGIAIVVLAVLLSAVTFGAYGWGLFVITPLLVGLTTGYLVNLDRDLGGGTTMGLVIAAAALGSLALVVLALEGIVCILMAAPLAIPLTMFGGVLGRAVAVSRLRRNNPLASVAVLPLLFMVEAAIPPDAAITTARSLEIDAPPAAVWTALTSPAPIEVEPGLTALAGLAYPLGARLEASGSGAIRLGAFSTGQALERVTEWRPGRVLAFRVLSQPPAMEEMSPYRRVHARHLVGYFETGETRFELVPLADGGTRLTIAAEHRLRIDPVPYWAPIARLAIRDNVDRVLRDIAEKAQRR